MMSCISNDIKNNKPELDYCTTVDIWTMGCWLLIIFGYIQFGLVQYFNQKRENDTKVKFESILNFHGFLNFAFNDMFFSRSLFEKKMEKKTKY
jgi:hypothetical protein